MKGIVLAGGSGSRLIPLTLGVNKHLLPVHDKPLIYYPLATLMLAGIRDIAIVCRQEDLSGFVRLLGDGSSLGLNLTFVHQDAPLGIAHGLLVGRAHAEGHRVCLILGDNVFAGRGLGESLGGFASGDHADIFAHRVADPRPYAVVELDGAGRPMAIEEKPANPRSALVVPGLYFFPPDCFDLASQLPPSPRGEFEVTDLNRTYLELGRLDVTVLPRGTTWFDAGSTNTLIDCSAFVRVTEDRQAQKLGCVQEVAWRQGWISSEELLELAQQFRGSPYSSYLVDLLEDETH